MAAVEGVCFYDPEIYAIVSRWESLVSFQILFFFLLLLISIFLKGRNEEEGLR